MTDRAPVPNGTSAPSSELVPEVSEEFQSIEDASEPRAIKFRSVIRRHLLMIGVCIGLAALAAGAVTFRTTPVYQAMASIRIDEKSGAAAALGALTTSGSSGMATELEMLRSRQLAEEVADSVSYRLRILEPRTAPRSAIFANVAVSRTAPAGRHRLVGIPHGQFVLLDDLPGAAAGTTGDTLARAVEVGERVQAGGLTFKLATAATQYPTIVIDIVPFERAVDSLERVLQVSRRSRDADIVEVSVRDPDPAYARDVANTVVRRFIEGGLGARQLKARSTVSFLREQLERVGKQLAGTSQAVGEFRQRQHIVNLPAEASSGVTRRAELQAERNSLESERRALDNLFRATVSDSGSTGNFSASRRLLAFPTLLKSGIASDVVAALAAAEERRAELLSRRTEQDPDVARVTARIAQLQQQIGSLVSTYLHGLSDQIGALDSVLAQSDANLQSIPGKDMRLADLQRQADGNEAIYTMLQSRLQEAEIAAATVDQTINFVDAAILPGAPVAPRPMLNLALALMTGGMLGLAGAFLREHTDPALHTRRELRAVTGVPVLGLVPRLYARRRLLVGRGRRPRSHSQQERLAHSYGSFVGASSMTSPPPPATPRASTAVGSWRLGFPSGDASRSTNLFIFTEALARLATNLALLAPEQRPRVLMVTSSLPGDGKTTIAANLALALARAGQRVLLLDADLRGGRIAQLVAIQQRVGLAELLGGRAEAAQIVEQVGTWSNGALYVIAAGVLTGVPAELLGSAHAHQLIDWARSAYDMVVLDTPPVTSVADATVLAPLVDGVVLVARAGTTAREALMFTVEQLRIVRAPVVGAVLNDVDLRRDASYDGAYEYYGRYGPVVE
jgi:succinoglycan biosynthesis transport protein ExoP